jgi:hypothetical protein
MGRRWISGVPFLSSVFLAILGAIAGTAIGLAVWGIAELDAHSAAEVEEALRSKPEPIRPK